MSKRLVLIIVGAVVVGGAIVAILAMLNARDPYGGPIEPATEH